MEPLNLIVKCPVHGTALERELTSYMNLWVCNRCKKCYTDSNVSSFFNQGKVKGFPLATLPDEGIKLVAKQIEEYKWGNQSKPYIVPDELRRNKNRDKQRKAPCKKQKKVPVVKDQCITKAVLTLPHNIEKIPQSAIVKATLWAKKSFIGQCVIVTNSDEQDTANGIFWSERGLSKTIMSAIFNAKTHILYKEVGYAIEIQEYELFDEYKKATNHFFSEIKPQIIYVFKHKNFEHYNSQQYETVTAFVRCSKMDSLAPISVIYSKETGIYLINLTSYQLFNERYGFPYIRLKSIEYGGGSMEYELSDQSELALYGYNVGKKDGLIDQERKELLSRIIESGLMPKHDIVNHLEWLIKTRKDNKQMQDSCAAWRDDLMFVQNYNINEQRVIISPSFQIKSNKN